MTLEEILFMGIIGSTCALVAIFAVRLILQVLNEKKMISDETLKMSRKLAEALIIIIVLLMFPVMILMIVGKIWVFIELIFNASSVSR